MITVKINQLKIVIFTAVKNRCILHGRVFVMLNFLLTLIQQSVVISSTDIVYSCKIEARREKICPRDFRQGPT